MNYISLISLPFITAFIGWLTNWVAIRMLFRPKKRFSLKPFFSFQGLIPRRKAQIASTIGQIVERDILSSHTIQKEFTNLDLTPYLTELSHRLVYEKLGPKLQEIPFIGNFINQDALAKLEKMATQSISEEAAPLMQKLAADAESRIHVKQIIEEKINSFDLDKLESIIMETAQKEFRMIEWVGAILGFLVGLGQLAILWLTGSLSL